MNQILSRVPKPILVVVVLVIAIGLFVLKDPLRDECEVQAKIFDRNTKGILTAIKKNKKIQFAKITVFRDICRDGNSIGACADYFEALRKIANELKVLNEKCQIKYAEENEIFIGHIGSALQVMSLVAWGEKPPASISDRAGWLIEPDLKTFCTLKKAYLSMAGEEAYLGLRNRIYLDYPDSWPDTLTPDSRKPEDRPRALKTAANPKGLFDSQQIYERSLFSIRCDLYL